MQIGRRLIKYSTPSGEVGDISITLVLSEPVHSTLTDGTRVSDHSGEVIIESPLFNHSISADGQDDCQVLFRAMQYCDAAVRKIAADHQLELSAVRPIELAEPFAVFTR